LTYCTRRTPVMIGANLVMGFANIVMAGLDPAISIGC
jgi:hypothetical protein